MKRNTKLKTNIKVFKEILMMEQEELHFYLLGKLSELYDNSKIFRVDEQYTYVAGDIPVVLLAHLDTVHYTKPNLSNLFHDQEKNAMWCIEGIGGDDRCGVFTILEILSMGYRPHIMFCWNEEIGCKGSGNLVDTIETNFGEPVQEELQKINFAVQIDRKGFGEAVYYDLDNKEFEDYISGFGFKTEIGSFTDIGEICPEFGFAGVNVSAGYINEHTTEEVIYINEMNSTRDKIIRILQDQMRNPKFFKYTPFAYSYGSGWGSQYGSWSGYSYGGYSAKSTYKESDDLDYDDDEVGDPYGFDRKPNYYETTCQYCYNDLIEGVNFDHSEDEVLNHLCNNCRVAYREDTENAEQYTQTIAASRIKEKKDVANATKKAKRRKKK